MNLFRLLVALVICESIGSANASDKKDVDLPEVASRTYSQNYKDMMLAACIGTAYKSDAHASGDATDTASALNEWGNYDVENSTGKTEQIIDQYMARKYNSIHGENVRLDLLKCLDMYHSKELDAQVKRYVGKPNHTYRQDHPPKAVR